MEKINAITLCGELEVDISAHGKITKVHNSNPKNKCIIPSIIKTIINEHNLEDTKDIIENLYCQKCGSGLHYNSCGRALLRELSLLTFK